MTERLSDGVRDHGRPAVAVSVVTNGHARHVARLLDDMERHCAARALRVILTLNIPEDLPFEPAGFSFPVSIRKNPRPLGFAANHNAAYASVEAPYFCVTNPDIRLIEDPFPALLSSVTAPDVGVVGPLVRNSAGVIEDSARRLPTPARIAVRLLKGRRNDYHPAARPLSVEWVAGMFMLFPSQTFESMSGFNDRFFLYYEDVDLCTRMRLAGYRVLLDPSTFVVHDAQRRSRSDSRYLRWHVVSAIRFFTSSVFFRALRQRSGSPGV